MTWPNADQFAVLVSDIAVSCVVVGAPVFAYLVWRTNSKRLNRRRRLAVTAVLLLGLALTVFAAFIEPRRLVVNDYAVDLRGSVSDESRHLRLVVVSDTHFGLFKGRSWANGLVARINSLEPDAVLFVGDLVSSPSGLGDLAAFGDLKTRLGSYAVLGNWDYHIGAVDVRRKLGSHGVITLVNRSVNLDDLKLVGIDGIIYGNPDWGEALADVGEGDAWITMVHNPDGALWASRFGSGLTIAGHTHGGQVRLPLVGSVPPLPTRLGRGYDRGLLELGGRPLLITSGAGESSARVRLFQPPELALLEVIY
jgi:hypothetical protein